MKKWKIRKIVIVFSYIILYFQCETRINFSNCKIFVFRCEKKSKSIPHTDKYRRRISKRDKFGGCTQNWRNMHVFRLSGITEFWLHVSFFYHHISIRFHQHSRNHTKWKNIQRQRRSKKWKKAIFFLDSELSERRVSV